MQILDRLERRHHADPFSSFQAQQKAVLRRKAKKAAVGTVIGSPRGVVVKPATGIKIEKAKPRVKAKTKVEGKAGKAEDKAEGNGIFKDGKSPDDQKGEKGRIMDHGWYWGDSVEEWKVRSDWKGSWTMIAKQPNEGVMKLLGTQDRGIIVTPYYPDQSYVIELMDRLIDWPRAI